MSDAGRRSRATVRDIPVQRSQSAFSYSRAPTTNNGSMLNFETPGAGGTGWTTTRYEAGNPGEEYYRREVSHEICRSRISKKFILGHDPDTCNSFN